MTLSTDLDAPICCSLTVMWILILRDTTGEWDALETLKMGLGYLSHSFFKKAKAGLLAIWQSLVVLFAYLAWLFYHDGHAALNDLRLGKFRSMSDA